VILAQALGEYGALSALTDVVSRTWFSTETFIRNVEPTTWALVGAGALILWLLWGRTR
jgi:hypothetical protein